MPPRIRDLIKNLQKNGFTERGGKGSHRNFRHPNGQRVTLSGKPSEDAKKYQVSDVEIAIRESQE